MYTEKSTILYIRRETGYLGNLWGADFYVSDQVAYGTMYVMTSPKFLAWMPFRRIFLLRLLSAMISIKLSEFGGNLFSR